MFHLSNKVVQVYFKDKTELMIDLRNKTLIYMGKNDLIMHLTISDAMKSDHDEFKRRFDYVKEQI